MNAVATNPIDDLVAQYKHGYKTSEFWVALATGVAQPLVAAFDPNQHVSSQLSNLTWIAITYILGRSGLKVVRANSTAKLAATQVVSATAPVLPAVTNGGGAPSSRGFDRYDVLITLRDRGIISSTQYEEAKEQLATE